MQSYGDYISEAPKYRGDMLIGWVDPKNKLYLYAAGGKMGKYHTQILANIMSLKEMRKFMPDRWGIAVAQDMMSFVKSGAMTEKQLKIIIDRNYQSIYDKLKSGKLDGDHDTEENLEKAGWVKIRIDRTGRGRSSVHGDLRRCHAAAKVLDSKLGGWQGISTERFYVENGKTEVSDERTWNTYVKTGRVGRQTEIGRTMSRFRESTEKRIPKTRKNQDPKTHSDLYTDEDPKGTIHGLGFKDVATAKASVAKIKRSGRKHAHKIQAAIAMEQRARVMGKTAEAAVYRAFINSMKKKTKAMKEGWSDKYKKSIDCSNPKGFSQRAHCQGRKKRSASSG